jgi:hypothetical protein
MSTGNISQLDPQTTQIVPDHWPKIAAITGKQTTNLQSYFETYMDLCNTIVGIKIQLYYRHPGKIPVESVKDNYGRTVVCAECGDKK